jgi:hypothetical protein
VLPKPRSVEREIPPKAGSSKLCRKPFAAFNRQPYLVKSCAALGHAGESVRMQP